MPELAIAVGFTVFLAPLCMLLCRFYVLLRLHEQGLLASEQVGTVLVVTLSERGHDVATGRARVPGVARPGA